MNIIIRSWIYQLALMGFLCLLASSCKKNEDTEEDPLKVITLTPPTDKIPYEALGSGKILFYRTDYITSDIAINMIDIDKKRTSAFKLNSLMLQPSLSPDGSKIVFSLFTNVTTAYDVYIMNSDGSGSYLVYQLEYQDRYPSWTIDGSKILVFSTSLYGPLYMQSPVENPTDRVELTKFHYDDDPTCFIEPSGGFSISPGQKLVCSNLINQIRGLLSIEPYVGKSGVSLLLPTPTDQHFESPAFSPDGSKIAFLVVETDPSVYGWNAVVVKTIDPDGSNLTELIRVTPFKTPIDWMHYPRYCDVSLCWSPDGKKILFTYPTEENGCHLFVINSDGTGLTQVTDNVQAYDADVSWGR
jgi:Tol biopolymer transport system component